MKKKLPAAAWILIAMVVGIIIGYMIFTNFPDKKAAATIAGYVSIMSDVFLRLIKMLIGPLVFSTLVVGIAHMGDAKSVGRVFGKALGWFVTASLISLILGLIMANLLKPGENLGLPLPDIGASANLATSKFTLKDFVSHLVPKSFAEAMANNEILQIVVFSVFVGTAVSAVENSAPRPSHSSLRSTRSPTIDAEGHRLCDEDSRRWRDLRGPGLHRGHPGHRHPAAPTPSFRRRLLPRRWACSGPCLSVRVF